MEDTNTNRTHPPKRILDTKKRSDILGLHNTPQGEIWKVIPNYKGYYEVSNLGRVRSVSRILTDSEGKVRRITGKILSVSSRRTVAKPNM